MVKRLLCDDYGVSGVSVSSGNERVCGDITTVCTETTAVRCGAVGEWVLFKTSVVVGDEQHRRKQGETVSECVCQEE